MSKAANSLGSVGGSAPGVEDPRLVEALQGCIQDVEQGKRIDRQKVLDAHPEFAVQLADCLDALEFVYSVAPQIGGSERQSTDPPDAAMADIHDRVAIGDFKLIREIGRGGMGIVYLAEQLSLGRQVALKVLPFAAMLDPRQLERFKNEARAAALLHHPHIVPIYSVSSDRGVYYYAMQFVEGRTLAELVDELKSLKENVKPSRNSHELAGLWDIRDGEGSSTNYPVNSQRHIRAIARIALQAAEALDHAHQLGVIHRDIKPSNLMIDRIAHLWVTDFGLARIESAGDLTMTGDVLGTLRYMSPEQALGSRLPIDHRTDIYSLGATLYELLTLQPAIVGQQRKDVLRFIELQEPQPPRRKNSAIPRQLEIIVAKAMAKHRDDRYLRASHLARDLERFLNDQPILARPPSVWQKLESVIKRHRGVCIAGSLAVVILMVATIVGLAIGNRMISRERDRVESQKARAEDAERQSQYRLFKSLMSEAELARRAGIGGQFRGLELLSEASAMVPELDIGATDVMRCRNATIAALALTDLQLDRSWQIFPNGIDQNGAAFDPPMHRYAYSVTPDTVSVRMLDDNLQVMSMRVPEATGHAWTGQFQFSPNGRFLATQGSTFFGIPARVWDLTDASVCLQVEPSADSPAVNLNFSPDSKTVVIGRDDGLSLYDIESKNLIKHIDVEETPLSVEFGPHGKMVACAGSNLQVVDVESSQMLTRWKYPADGFGMVHCTWHPDGQRLAVAGYDSLIHIVNWNTESIEVTCTGHETIITKIAFNNRGDLLASAGWNGTTFLWDPRSGRRLLRTEGTSSVFSNDDRWLGLGSIGSVVGRWNIGRPFGYAGFHGSAADQSSFFDFSADDRLIASPGEDGVHLWDTHAARELTTLKLGPCFSTAFRPDGSGLFVASKSGLFELKVQREDNRGSRIIRFGTANRIALPDDVAPIQCQMQQNGRSLLVKTWPDRALVYDCQTGKISEPIDAREVWFACLSPKSRWLALANWHGSIGIWNLESKSIDLYLPFARSRFAFSPDAELLVIGSNNQFQIRQTDTWKLVQQLGRVPSSAGTTAAAAFSPRQDLLALATTNRAIKLYRVPGFQELATLTPPSESMISFIKFNGSGTTLAVLCQDGLLHVWNLPDLRAKLREMAIDWDPASKVARSSTTELPQIKIEFDADVGN